MNQNTAKMTHFSRTLIIFDQTLIHIYYNYQQVCELIGFPGWIGTIDTAIMKI